MNNLYLFQSQTVFMEDNFLHKVYDFVNHIIHLDDMKLFSQTDKGSSTAKQCPITGLDISMQPNNSKFLSYTGVRWYYEHDHATFIRILIPRIQDQWRNKDIDWQFRAIAHNIRNSDSNPRNNTRRKIKRILADKNSLFNNLDLIDKKKLREAGYIN